MGFDGSSFIDVFVGKNGSSKLNLLEALVEIFRHLYECDKERGNPGFSYAIKYEIDGKETKIAWSTGNLSFNDR